MTGIQNLVIDPPWPKKKGGLRKVTPNQTRELPYQTMPVRDIFSLLDAEVFPKAADQHNVWLWTVDEFLLPAECEMEMRGYKRHARIVWDKGNGVAPAFTVRYTHEYLLWYYKPKLLPIALHERGKLGTVIRAPSREHSRKPDEAYDMVARLYPESSRMDVFSRERRPGWLQWGNQTEFFG